MSYYLIDTVVKFGTPTGAHAALLLALRLLLHPRVREEKVQEDDPVLRTVRDHDGLRVQEVQERDVQEQEEVIENDEGDDEVGVWG